MLHRGSAVITKASGYAGVATIALSVTLHALAILALSTIDATRVDEKTPFEFEIAPNAPEADDLGGEEPEPEPEPAPEPEPEPEPDPLPAPDPDPAPEPLGTLDAGPLPDAAIANDAGPRDAGSDASTTDLRDASVIARNPRDAGTALGTGSGGTQGGIKTVGVGIDLAKSTPPRDHLAIAIRLDRLRRTTWAKDADAILAPMPDYSLIVGRRKIDITERFDLLLVSTSDPNNVAKTNLAARSSTLSPGELRSFLSHSDAPTRWQPVTGGAQGTVGTSPFFSEGDPRVYLTPLPGWVVLTDPKHLDGLLAVRGGSLDGLPEQDTLPKWLRAVPSVMEQTGRLGDGPAVSLSARGLPEKLAIPLIGDFPTPQHVSVALWTKSIGLVARGVMIFSSAERAEAFVNKAEATKRLATAMGPVKLLLRRFNAYNALAGLSLKRSGSRVSFATSVSVKDGKVITALAAEMMKKWYARGRREADPNKLGGEATTKPDAGAQPRPAARDAGPPKAQ